MTQLLDQELAELEKLPKSEQDAIAALVLEEIADERPFARSQDRPRNWPARSGATTMGQHADDQLVG